MRSLWSSSVGVLVRRRQGVTKLFRDKRIDRSYYILQTHANPSVAQPVLPKTPSSINPLPTLSSTITAILLVTPHYASLLGPGSNYLEDLVNSSKILNLQAVAAVVDGLPGDTGSSSASRHRGWSWLITDEPITLLEDKIPQDVASQEKDIKLPSWLAERSQGRRFDPGPADQASRMEDKGGRLTFEFPCDSTLLEWISAKTKLEDQKSIAIRFGLANTLFHTGSWSVIRYFSTAHTDVNDSPSSLTISLPASCTYHPDITLPLDALTQPRIVHSGNGNILTKLALPGNGMTDSHGGIFPASNELEKAVASWFTKHPALSENNQKNPIAIFARIASSEATLQTPVGSGIITNNERICRVLSGGGGWGDNAGLLALDPQDFRGFEIPGRDLQETTNEKGLINKGDWIQFFIAASQSESYGIEGTGFHFGGVDKAEDLVVDEESLADEEVVRDGVFGAVAEGGFYVDKHKVDVPGGRITMSAK